MVDLFCWVDDHIEKCPRNGRPSVLSETEIITLLLWNTIAVGQKTLVSLHRHARLHLRQEFPRLPAYQNFVAHCHRVLPQLWQLLDALCVNSPIRLVDSTMLPVCKLHRVNQHKVAKDAAAFGYNHQGAHYGFKLHTSVSLDGVLCAFHFTSADTYDGQVLPELVDRQTQLAIGDRHYGGKVMRQHVHETYGTTVLTPPLQKQQRKMMTAWQQVLLDWRTKIESVYDRLKEHLHLVSSFPRSINGYLLHYVRILLGYQILALTALR